MLTCCNAARTAFVTVVLSNDDIVATAASMWAILDETVLMSVLMVVELRAFHKWNVRFGTEAVSTNPSRECASIP